jgi:sulfide dehydrogenase cytochrome subunit
VALAMSAGLAHASDAANQAQVKAWASACLTCHSAPQGKETNAIPSLYGMSASRIENQMRAYAAGEKPGLLMQQLAKGYDPEVLRQIALWFQNTPKE